MIVSVERIGWASYRERIGPVMPGMRELLPDVLVISPAKTGSSWLFEMIRRHPGFFAPEVKEVRYFCKEWRIHDLAWYAARFLEGKGKVRVDVSPTYALLPHEAIRLIREIIPSVKLVFLVRDPVSRAWSHAKHMALYGEGCFSGPQKVADVSPDAWKRGFLDDWALAHGDYAACLRRWMAIFPREQLYVNFFEEISRSPAALLHEICEFCAVPSIPLPDDVLRQRVFEGSPEIASATQIDLLRWMLRRRAEESESLLRDWFGVRAPAEWANSAEGHASEREHFVELHRGEAIAFDGLSFCSRTRAGVIRSRLKEQLRICLDNPDLRVGEESEDAALKRILDSVLAPAERANERLSIEPS